MTEGHPNHRPRNTLPPELRRTTVPSAVRSWVRRELEVDVLRWKRLPGASTSAVHRLMLASGQSVVLRRYVWRWVLEDSPEVPYREVDALQFAAANGLPVPAVLAADPDGTSVGDGVPALVMSFVPGSPVAVPDLHDLAQVAVSVHCVNAFSFPHRYYPWYRGALTDAPPGAVRTKLWRQAIDIWHRQMPDYKPNLLHRDFHPGNVLWRRRGAHVVDWANTCAGPWGCDVAHCRDNLIQLRGVEAADAFLERYLEVAGVDYDPYWEVASVLEHSPESFDASRIAMSEQRLGPAVATYG